MTCLVSFRAMAEANARPKSVREFRHPTRLPKTQRPMPEVDLEVMHHAENVDSDSERLTRNSQSALGLRA